MVFFVYVGYGLKGGKALSHVIFLRQVDMTVHNPGRRIALTKRTQLPGMDKLGNPQCTGTVWWWWSAGFTEFDVSQKTLPHDYITSCLHHWHADTLPAKHRLSSVLRNEDSSGQVICFTVLRVTELSLIILILCKSILSNLSSARCFHARLDT